MTELADDNLLRAEAVRRAELVRDISYDVVLDLTGDEHTFLSDTTIGFAGGDGADGAELFLDLIAKEVSSVTIDGLERKPEEVVQGSRLRLGGLTSQSGGRHEVRVVARCAYEHTSKGLHRFVDPA